jgi:hypothetical protein
MSALVWLFLRTLRNRLLDILRTPAKLITWLIVLALIVGIAIFGQLGRGDGAPGDYLDLIWLKGAMFLLLTLIFGLQIRSGLKNGDKIFDINDVNFLFTSPLRPQSILLFGITHSLGSSLLGGFFLLFQGATVANVFGLPYSALLFILLGFVLAATVSSILSLLIYNFTNGKPRAKTVAGLIAVCLFLPAAFVFVLGLTGGGSVLVAAESMLRHPAFSWIPVVGWAAQGMTALIAGDMLAGLLWLGLLVLVGAALVALFAKSNPDYYEDVLVAAETAFEKTRTLMEGQANMEAISNRRVKVLRTGIGGAGASSIFRKHLRESFRANRLGLWGISSFVMVGGALLFAIIMRGKPFDWAHILLQILLWTQMFLIGMGRGLRELYSHYLYLIPESSFRKIVWSNLETTFKSLVESFVMFFVGGLIVGAPLPMSLACVLAFALYSLLLVSVNFFWLRFTGINVSAGLGIVLYIAAVLVGILPGIALGMVVGFAIGGATGMTVGILLIAAWETAASLAFFALSRGALDKMDMPQVRMPEK